MPDLLAVPKAVVRTQLALLRVPQNLYASITQKDDGGEAAETRRSALDGIVGSAKEVIGAALDNDRLVEEGRIQRTRAERLSQAATSETIAKAERQEAQSEFLRRQQKLQTERQATEEQRRREEAEIERQREEEERRVRAQAAQKEQAVNQKAAARRQAVAKEEQQVRRQKATG